MKSFRQSIISQINKGNIAGALTAATGFTEAHPEVKKEFGESLLRLEQRYFYMLRFMIGHGTAPETDADYESIIEDFRTLVDRICRYADAADSSGLYASQVRFFNMRPEENLQTLIVDYITENESLQLDTDSLLSSGCFDKRERIGQDIFKRIWTEFPLCDDDTDAVRELIADNTLPEADRVSWVSALMLGLLEYYDIARFKLLADIYCGNGSMRISVAALCGLLLGLFRYRNRRPDARLKAILKELPGRCPSWNDDVQTVFLEFIRSRDTERISRKMKEEIMPGMMKIGGRIMDRMKDSDSEADIESLVENPEWTGLTEGSPIFEQIKQLNDLQMEGGDVFMSTFANMRSFHFFHDIANWFLPFTPGHSSLAGFADGDGATVAEVISSIPVFCDSDKYAVLLALASTPESMRRQAMEQMSRQSHEMLQQLDSDYMRTAAGEDSDSFRRHTNNYVKNIYRFFKLFRRKNEFFDPFSKGISPVGIPALSEIYDTAEARRLLAEFFFRLGFYSEAAGLLEKTAAETSDPVLYERAAFAFEKSGDIIKAVDLYRESLLSRPDNVWTLRRLAECLRKTSRPDEASAIFGRLVRLCPDDIALLTEYGMTLIESGDNSTAVEILSQADYRNGSTDMRTMRGLAWALMMSGDLERAAGIYGRIAGSDRHTWSDTFNFAHLHLARKEFGRAVDMYCSLVADPKGSAEIMTLAQKMNEDADVLAALGVNADDTARCIDAVYYRLIPCNSGTL